MIKILVLDDEQGTCEQLVEFLGYRGYKVFGATEGQEALDLIERERPDILLLDVKMPGTDGIQVLEQARRMLKKVRGVMITAVKDPEVRRQALEGGAEEYLSKPFSYEALEGIIIRLVNDIVGEGGSG